MKPTTRNAAAALALVGLATLGGTQLVDDPAPSGGPPGAVDTVHFNHGSSGSTHGSNTLATRSGNSAIGQAPASRAETSWILDEVMVKVTPGTDLQALAARHGASVSRAIGRSGLAGLKLPVERIAQSRQALKSDPDVVALSTQGRVQGASTDLSVLKAGLSAAEDAVSQAELDVESATDALNDAQDTFDEADEDLEDAMDDGLTGTALQAWVDAFDEAALRVDTTDAALTDAQSALTVAQADLAALDVEAAAAASTVATTAGYQWHLEHSQHPHWSQRSSNLGLGPDPISNASIIVAVLDSGLALTASGASAAPSLANLNIVSPSDIIDGDATPQDDHQHGTHITSLIAGEDSAFGIAPGVSVMPVRVLDANNSGTELDLIEGLWHAIDNGASIINLSLTFGADYLPSQALNAALAAARDAGIVMVAAAGNDSGTTVLWPAASPYVVAVGATTLHNSNISHRGDVTDYSNRGLAIDIVAAGGDNDEDQDRNGHGDGVVAETYSPTAPTSFGLWSYAGTSQAAALVSGTAAQLLAAGASPFDVVAALQVGAQRVDKNCWSNGCGSGELDIEESLEAVEDNDLPTAVGPLYTSVLPWMDSRGSRLAPSFEIAVVDSDGNPVSSARVYAQAWKHGESPSAETCTTDTNGTCTMTPWGRVSSSTGNNGAFAVQVTTAVVDDVGHHPTSLMFATDGLAYLQAAIAADTDLADSLLGIAWDAGTDPVLGDMAASYAFVDWGAGLASSPLGVVLGIDALPPGTTANTVSLDLDGGGLASSPLGVVPVLDLDFDEATFSGGGLASSPLGLLGLGDLSVVMVSGSGLASSPLGFSGTDITIPPAVTGGAGLASSPLGYLGEPIFPAEGVVLGAAVDDTLEAALANGTFIGGSLVGGATALVGAGVVGPAATVGLSVTAPESIAN